MSEMIQGAGHYFSGLPLAQSEEEQRKQLENYLEEYASQYGFSVQIWDIVYEVPDGASGKNLRTMKKSLMYHQKRWHTLKA